jgi:hypothetical protein
MEIQQILEDNSGSMQSYLWKKWKTGSTFSLSVKCGAVLLLLLFSVLIVACGGGTSTDAANLGDPQPTITIQIGNNQSSPTPSLPGEWCGAWVTNPTPSYTAGTIAVYAKFTQNVNGNPAGIGSATATAHVMWTPTDIDTYTAVTTSDGLAVFPISVNNKNFAVNTITLVTVTFHKDGEPDCTVDQDRAAFFTLIHASATATTTKTPTSKPNSTPTTTPSPQGGATPTVTTGITPTTTPPAITPTVTLQPGH